MAINIWEEPELRNPCLVVGWPDAGYVGLKVASYLSEKLGAREFGEIALHEFSLMPQSIIQDGVLRALDFPHSEFSYWVNERAEQDVIIFSSDIPALRQHAYANLILDVAQRFNVQRIYTAGGLYARIHHAVTPRILAVVNREELTNFVKAYEDYDVVPGIDYHGPTSMNGLLIGLARERGIDGISLWGQVPHYLGELPNPVIAQAVLKALSAMLAVDVDLGEIEAEVKYVTERIERMIAYFRGQYPEFDQYLDKLEQGMAAEMSEGEAKRLFREIEDFLKGDQSY